MQHARPPLLEAALACTHVTCPTQSPDRLRGWPERLMLTTAAPMASPCWHTRLPTKPLPPNTTKRGRYACSSPRSAAELAEAGASVLVWLSASVPGAAPSGPALAEAFAAAAMPAASEASLPGGLDVSDAL